MELKRSHRFIIAFFSLFILISLIQDSYAKYLTNATAATDISIARWSILVNNQDIVNNSDFSNKIQPVFPGSDNISSSIIAPLSEGYFDLIIDYTEVDVSFAGKINLSHSDDNTISDLIFTGYSINDGSIIPLGGSTAEISKTVLLSEVTRTETYRIYVKWLDGTGEDMDNSEDTEATKSGTASIKADVSFTQIPD